MPSFTSPFPYFPSSDIITLNALYAFNVAVSVDIRYALYSTGIIPIINRFYNPVKFVNIFRSVFTAVSLWMIYLVYRDNRDSQLADRGVGN